MKVWLKRFSTIYIITSLFFIIWMIFLDTNSVLILYSLDQKIEELQQQKETLEKEISSDQKLIQQLKDSFQLERYGREKFYLKKENEEIFIIEDQRNIED